MKMFLKFAGIPLALFVVLFGLPRLIATLLNSHTDVGLFVILVLVCGIFGWVTTKAYNIAVKETDNEA